MIRTLTYLMLLFLIFASCKTEKKVINVPWYVSVNDTDFANYSFADTLKKYQKIDIERVQNKANFLAFLSDLNYLNDNVEEGDKLIEAAFEADSIELCKRYTLRLSKYLFKANPYRKTSIPGIFKKNFDQYAAVYIKCADHTELKGFEPSDLIRLEDRLWLAYLSVLDQWYRVHKREMNGEKQREYDRYCRSKLDEIFGDKTYPKVRKIKSNLSTLIIHSEDCDWSYKWLKKYIETYKDDKLLSKYLRHLLKYEGCPCGKDPKIIEIVEKTLSEL